MTQLITYSLKSYQTAYDLGVATGESSECPFSDKGLIRAFITGVEQALIKKYGEDYVST